MERFKGGAAVVDIWFKAFVIAKIQFIFEILHVCGYEAT